MVGKHNDEIDIDLFDFAASNKDQIDKAFKQIYSDNNGYVEFNKFLIGMKDILKIGLSDTYIKDVCNFLS